MHEATALLRALQQISEDFEAYLARKLTVNPTDFQAMEHLILNGPLSPTQIAKRLGVSTAATTAVVDRLTAVGHVTRMPNPNDRRGVLVVPAEESVARAMAGLMPMILGIDHVISDFSTAEQATITDYLRRVVAVYRDSIPAADAAGES